MQVSGIVQNGRVLVLAVYVTSLVLVAFGHCAPSFAFALPVVEREQGHHHDGDSHDNDLGGSSEECSAELVAKGCVSSRNNVVELLSDSPVSVPLSIQVWSKSVPLATLPPERPPDIIPRAHSGYAQILARTGRMIV